MIISKNVADKLFPGKPPLVKSKINLHNYTKDSLTILGKLKVNAFINDNCILNLKMLVILEEGLSLIAKT